MVITHGHGDHYGGARYLNQTYGAKVVASTANWDMMAKASADGSVKGLEPPARDMVMADGQALTLGGTTIRFYSTPATRPAPCRRSFPSPITG